MPFCPVCKREFPDRVEECPGDKRPLVDELPIQIVPGDTTTWIKIASPGNEEEASLLQGFLQAEGIPAQIENVQFHMEPTNFGLLGDIRVYVPVEEEAKALELLAQREEMYDKVADDDDVVVTDEGPARVDETVKVETDNE